MDDLLESIVSEVKARFSDQSDLECWSLDWAMMVYRDGKGFVAARAMYEYMFGSLPYRQRIHRTCGNGLCVNPNHLLPSSSENKFWRLVDIPTNESCWMWLGAVDGGGYGMFRSPKFTEKKAHRISWVISNGEIPDGLDVLHSCDNPGCCNPRHLFLGTDLDNVRDKFSKNREATFEGQNNGMCKLNKDKVIEIRSLHSSGVSYRSLAKRFGIGATQVGRIVRRESWRWLWED
jgi:hypothetical protein